MSPCDPLPRDPLRFVFNLVRLPATGDRAEADRLLRDNRAAYDRIRDAGGTLYPVSALPMSPEDRRRSLGPAHASLEPARRILDPGGILTPGYEVFAAPPGPGLA
ncbi:MAG: hypothetical protein AB7V42_03090 [Thermoleophilia bacterium]